MKAEGLKPPIFLLGNVRSGTSMLHDLFDLHPEVVSWYEPRTVWCYADPVRRHDRFTAADATPRVKRYIRGRFLKYQRAHGDRRVMEKTPSNLLRIPYVREIFPESRYVYVVREPLANLSSSELKWREPITLSHAWDRVLETPTTQLPFYVWRGVVDHFRTRVLKKKHVSVWGVRYPGVYEDLARLTVEQVIARQWVMCSRQADEDLAQIPAEMVLRIRYEDFVARPVEEFRRMLGHFGLGLPDELAEHVAKEVDPGRQAKWKRLDPDVLRACIPILREEMARHGYAVPDEVERMLPVESAAAGPA